jgi:hypothetical protein
MTQGQCGSLRLHRMTLSFTTPRRFSSALSGHPILFLSREKVRKNKIFKNNELKTGPLFRNTSPSESVHGFLFGFDESLANNEL